MDEADRANDEAAQSLARAIRNAADQMRRGAALETCKECGDPIPPKRRDAVPGCEYCVECQEWLDSGRRFYP